MGHIAEDNHLHNSLTMQKLSWCLPRATPPPATDLCSWYLLEGALHTNKGKGKHQPSYKPCHLKQRSVCIVCWSNSGTKNVEVTFHSLVGFETHSRR